MNRLFNDSHRFLTRLTNYTKTCWTRYIFDFLRSCNSLRQNILINLIWKAVWSLILAPFCSRPGNSIRHGWKLKLFVCSLCSIVPRGFPLPLKLGDQIWVQNGADWPQMGQIRDFISDQISVHFGAGEKIRQYRILILLILASRLSKGSSSALFGLMISSKAL